MANKIRGEHVDEIVKQLKEPVFNGLRSDAELYWGIRDGSINIYYKCASIAEVTYQFRSKKLRFKVAEDKIDGDPAIAILTVTGDETVAECRLTMRRYLFDNAPGKSSSRTAEKLLRANKYGIKCTHDGFEIYGEKLKKSAIVKTLFINQTLSNLNISDIYDLNNYEVGLG